MRKSILTMICLFSFVGVAHAQQDPTSPAQPSGAIQSPDVPDPSAVDPDTPPVIRDGRDNDESTEAAEDAAERRNELGPEHESDEEH